MGYLNTLKTFLVIKVLNAKGFGVLDSMFIVSWSVLIALHTSLHASQELPLPEQDAVLPEAGVVRFSGFQFRRVLVLLGNVALANVIMVLSARGFGIVDWQGTPRILQATPNSHFKHFDKTFTILIFSCLEQLNG